jgi:hypothetical protein
MALALVKESPELTTLDSCEAVIERGLATFVEVGTALLAIRDGKLYRKTHKTFEAYCRERWGFTDRRGRQLMDAAQVGTLVPNIPSERVARELAPLKNEPEQMRAVMTEAAALYEDKPTAAQVKEVVREQKAQRPKTKLTPEGKVSAPIAEALAELKHWAGILEIVSSIDLSVLPKQKIDITIEYLSSIQKTLTSILKQLKEAKCNE